jgi:hypothetical protein
MRWLKVLIPVLAFVVAVAYLGRPDDDEAWYPAQA